MLKRQSFYSLFQISKLEFMTRVSTSKVGGSRPIVPVPMPNLILSDLISLPFLALPDESMIMLLPVESSKPHIPVETSKPHLPDEISKPHLPLQRSIEELIELSNVPLNKSLLKPEQKLLVRSRIFNDHDRKDYDSNNHDFNDVVSITYDNQLEQKLLHLKSKNKEFNLLKKNKNSKNKKKETEYCINFNNYNDNKNYKSMQALLNSEDKGNDFESVLNISIFEEENLDVLSSQRDRLKDANYHDIRILNSIDIQKYSGHEKKLCLNGEMICPDGSYDKTEKDKDKSFSYNGSVEEKIAFGSRDTVPIPLFSDVNSTNKIIDNDTAKLKDPTIINENSNDIIASDPERNKKDLHQRIEDICIEARQERRTQAKIEKLKSINRLKSPSTIFKFIDMSEIDQYGDEEEEEDDSYLSLASNLLLQQELSFMVRPMYLRSGDDDNIDNDDTINCNLTHVKVKEMQNLEETMVTTPYKQNNGLKGHADKYDDKILLQKFGFEIKRDGFKELLREKLYVTAAAALNAYQQVLDILCASPINIFNHIKVY